MRVRARTCTCVRACICAPACVCWGGGGGGGGGVVGIESLKYIRLLNA